RNVLQNLKAFLTGDAKPAQTSIEDIRRRRWRRQHQRVDMIAESSRGRGGAAVERHVHGLDLGYVPEEVFGADIRSGAYARTGVGEALLTAAVDELLKVFDRIGRMDGEQVRTDRNDRDSTQVRSVITEPSSAAYGDPRASDSYSASA